MGPDCWNSGHRSRSPVGWTAVLPVTLLSDFPLDRLNEKVRSTRGKRLEYLTSDTVAGFQGFR